MNFCEAMVPVRDVWTRCGVKYPERHHRLTRARGGLILDAVGETYHILYLCRQHHNEAHDYGTAIKNGLLIDGYVTTGPQGTPIYSGTDQFLAEKYGRDVALCDLSEEARGA